MINDQLQILKSDKILKTGNKILGRKKQTLKFDTSLGTDITITLSGVLNETNTIFWGDGTRTDIIYTGSNTNYTHTYQSDIGILPIIFDLINFDRIIIISITGVKGNFNELSVNFFYLYILPFINGDLSSLFNSIYYVYLQSLPLVTGDLLNLSNVYYNLHLQSLPLVTGDLSNLSNVYYNLHLVNLPLITANSVNFHISLKKVYLRILNFSETELENIVTSLYNNAQTGGTLDITQNTTPNSATITMINTMVNDRGWTINYDI